jgi:hypothetical protein
MYSCPHSEHHQFHPPTAHPLNSPNCAEHEKLRWLPGVAHPNEHDWIHRDWASSSSVFWYQERFNRKERTSRVGIRGEGRRVWGRLGVEEQLLWVCWGEWDFFIFWIEYWMIITNNYIYKMIRYVAIFYLHISIIWFADLCICTKFDWQFLGY